MQKHSRNKKNVAVYISSSKLHGTYHLALSIRGYVIFKFHTSLHCAADFVKDDVYLSIFYFIFCIGFILRFSTNILCNVYLFFRCFDLQKW